jgi:hypothetical protein
VTVGTLAEIQALARDQMIRRPAMLNDKSNR